MLVELILKYSDKRAKQTIHTINQLGFDMVWETLKLIMFFQKSDPLSVSNYLAKKGNSKNRMTAPAFGEQQLKEKLFSDDARAKYRRVEIKIFK